jgi:hypothetical protein
MLVRISRLFSFAVERDWIEANSALRCEAAKASSRTWVVSSGRGVLLDLPGSSDNGRR